MSKRLWRKKIRGCTPHVKIWFPENNSKSIIVSLKINIIREKYFFAFTFGWLISTNTQNLNKPEKTRYFHRMVNKTFSSLWNVLEAFPAAFFCEELKNVYSSATSLMFCFSLSQTNLSLFFLELYQVRKRKKKERQTNNCFIFCFEWWNQKLLPD